MYMYLFLRSFTNLEVYRTCHYNLPSRENNQILMGHGPDRQFLDDEDFIQIKPQYSMY